MNITGKFGSRYLFTSITIQKVESSNGIISILWGCSDKKAERMIKSPAFLSSAAVWSHLPTLGLV